MEEGGTRLALSMGAGRHKISALDGRLWRNEKRITHNSAGGLVLTHGGPKGVVDTPEVRGSTPLVLRKNDIAIHGVAAAVVDVVARH